MNSIAEIKKNLVKAASIKNKVERSITLAALISQALQSIGQDPILVGGTAVEFYTEGGYSTADLDFVAAGGPKLTNVMEELGFKKMGKDFVHSQLKIYVEFPSSALKPSEKIQHIQINQYRLAIISLEDLIIDRLSSFKFWHSAIDGRNALLLLEMEEADQTHLLNRAQEEAIIDVLQLIQEVRETIIRKKLSKHAANQLLEKKMNELK